MADYSSYFRGYEPFPSRRGMDELRALVEQAKGSRITPPGRTPFFIGDKAVHEGPPPGPFPEEAQPLREPGVEVTVGMPVPVETPPRAAGALRVGRPSTGPSRGLPIEEVEPTAPGVQQETVGTARLSPRIEAFLAQRRTPQQTASSMQLGSRLARAGAMAAEALTGSRYDRGAYEGLEGDAARVVEEDRARQAMAARQAETAAERAMQERGMRLREEEATRGATEARRRNTLERQRLQQDASQFAARQGAEAEALRQRLASDAANRAQQREFMQEERKLRQGEKTERDKAARDERALQRLGEQTARIGAPEAAEAIGRIETLAPGLAYGQAPTESPFTPGDRAARYLPAGVGSWIQSERGQKLAAEVRNLRDVVQRMRSGAALNEGEAQHYLELLGDKAFSSPEALATGIDTVRRGMAAKLRTMQAGYGSVLPAFESAGGVTAQAPAFQGGPVRMQSPSGETWTITDPAEAEEAIKRGWRRL